MSMARNGETDSGGSDDEGVEVTCQHCDYTWVYSSDMWNATCPQCQRKTPTGLRPDEFGEDDG